MDGDVTLLTQDLLFIVLPSRTLNILSISLAPASTACPYLVNPHLAYLSTQLRPRNRLSRIFGLFGDPARHHLRGSHPSGVLISWPQSVSEPAGTAHEVFADQRLESQFAQVAFRQRVGANDRVATTVSCESRRLWHVIRCGKRSYVKHARQ